MMDQLRIGDKASYDDFEASVCKRSRKDGAKKEIKETVPFSNITYDFTAINGEIYWNEKELTYTFEIIADTPEELEDKIINFKSWVMNIISKELYDPFVTEYHFIATFKDIDVDDSEIEKATITVTFSAYPYMIANNPKVYEVELGARGSKEIHVMNESSHRITPIITTDNNIALTLNGGTTYVASAGITEDEAMKLDVGLNTLLLADASAQGAKVSISFYEEVF